MREDLRNAPPAVAAYIEAALWTDCDDDPVPGEFDAGRIDCTIPAATYAQARNDVHGFVQRNAEDIGDMDPEQLGHDLWLTRNRHGAGFWDRGLGERGTRLTDAAHAMGETYAYVGDDGRLYLS